MREQLKNPCLHSLKDMFLFLVYAWSYRILWIKQICVDIVWSLCATDLPSFSILVLLSQQKIGLFSFCVCLLVNIKYHPCLVTGLTKPRNLPDSVSRVLANFAPYQQDNLQSQAKSASVLMEKISIIYEQTRACQTDALQYELNTSERGVKRRPSWQGSSHRASLRHEVIQGQCRRLSEVISGGFGTFFRNG